MNTKCFKDIAQNRKNDYQIVKANTRHGWQPISKWKDKPGKASLDPLSQATLRSIQISISLAKQNLNKNPPAKSSLEEKLF